MHQQRCGDEEAEPGKEASIALYWDFENLHASLAEARQEGAYSKQDNRFKVQEPLIDIQAVVGLAASFGPIAINRAYCNWQYFSRYRDALLQNAVELIQLFPPGGSAKNGADIRLCLDVMEDMGRQRHIGTFIIVSGDSDFMPMAQKVKAAGRVLVGIGARPFTNRHWASSCHDFHYYENLLQNAEGAVATQPALPLADAAALIRRAMRLLTERQGGECVSLSALQRMAKRLDSTFDAGDYGCANLAALLQSLDAVVETIDGAGQKRLRLR